jgi:hypothetical protein
MKLRKAREDSSQETCDSVLLRANLRIWRDDSRVINLKAGSSANKRHELLTFIFGLGYKIWPENLSSKLLNLINPELQFTADKK